MNFFLNQTQMGERLSLRNRPLPHIHREIAEGGLHLIHTVPAAHHLRRHSHEADAAVLLLDGVSAEGSGYDDVALRVLHHTIDRAGRGVLHLLSYALHGIRHVGVVALCETGCRGSYYHQQRNHNLLHTLLYYRVQLSFTRQASIARRFFSVAKVGRNPLPAKHSDAPRMKCPSACMK